VGESEAGSEPTPLTIGQQQAVDALGQGHVLVGDRPGAGPVLQVAVQV
jgi:hypothetical protein